MDDPGYKRQKVTLTFYLPDNQMELRDAMDGAHAKSVLSDFDNYLRNILKHNPDNYTEDQLELAEKVRDTLHEKLNEYPITLD